MSAKKKTNEKSTTTNSIDRNWIDLKLRDNFQRNDYGSQLRVLSYNILNSSSAVPGFYRYCNPDYLKFSYRSPNILKEIVAHEPDIICIQEMDNFREFYLPQFSTYSYDALFTQRTGSKTDGCAIFYPRDHFYLSDKVEIQFNDLGPKFSFDNIAQIVLLEKISDKKDKVLPDKIVVVNTHLWWEPQRHDCRVAQVKMLLEELVIFLEKNSIDISKDPIIVCGDFNENSQGEACKRMNNEIPITQGSKLILKNAYNDYLKEIKYSPFTVHIPQIQDVIDHIWHSNNAIVPHRVFSLLNKTSINGGLPSQHLSSDHISIVCDFYTK